MDATITIRIKNGEVSLDGPADPILILGSLELAKLLQFKKLMGESVDSPRIVPVAMPTKFIPS